MGTLLTPTASAAHTRPSDLASVYDDLGDILPLLLPPEHDGLNTNLA